MASDHEVSYAQSPPGGFWGWKCTCGAFTYGLFFEKKHAEKYAERHLAEVEAEDGE